MGGNVGTHAQTRQVTKTCWTLATQSRHVPACVRAQVDNNRNIVDSYAMVIYVQRQAPCEHPQPHAPATIHAVRSGAGAMHVGNQPSSLAISPPHAGICSALVAILASYDPSTPHSIAAVINALGEERLKVRKRPMKAQQHPDIALETC